MDIIELFYRDIKKAMKAYQELVIDKEFIHKSGAIEEIPINLAKGKVEAVKQLDNIIASLYKKYKTTLPSE